VGGVAFENTKTRKGPLEARMRLLLDSHVVVWALVEPTQMTVRARAALADKRNQVYVSTVTVWELWSKFLKNPLKPMMRIIDAGQNGFDACLTSLDAERLHVSPRHMIAGARLPQIHGDPFDRILLGQAQVEGLTLLTRDRFVLSYPGFDFLEA
jgi:PIN domain nuclease of toxin-antitoxin system